MALRVMLISPSTTQDRTAVARVPDPDFEEATEAGGPPTVTALAQARQGLLGRDRQAGRVLPRTLPLPNVPRRSPPAAQPGPPTHRPRAAPGRLTSSSGRAPDPNYL
jgi:hypothetical protein